MPIKGSQVLRAQGPEAQAFQFPAQGRMGAAVLQADQKPVVLKHEPVRHFIRLLRRAHSGYEAHSTEYTPLEQDHVHRRA